MIVVSDTTPILSLVKAGRIGLLKELFKCVVIPEAVYRELTSNPAFENEKEAITNCPFLEVIGVRDQEAVRRFQNVTGLDIGESEALVLYEEKKADVLLMDEHKGRGVAKRLSINHVGTLGLLMLSYDKKILSARQIEDCLELLLNQDIRLSKNLCNKVLNYIGLEKRF